MSVDRLAERVRTAFSAKSFSEQPMFGGIAFMLNGNMFCGITRDDLMARVGSERFDEALSQPGARPMDFTGRRGGAGHGHLASVDAISCMEVSNWPPAVRSKVSGGTDPPQPQEGIHHGQVPVVRA